MFKHRASIGKSNEYKRYILLLFTLYRLYTREREKKKKIKKSRVIPLAGKQRNSLFIANSSVSLLSCLLAALLYRVLERADCLDSVRRATQVSTNRNSASFHSNFLFFFIFRSMRISTRFIRYPSELKKKKKRYGRYTREITKRFGGRALSPLPRCLARKSVYIFTRARIEGGRSAYFLMHACNLFDARARK